MGFIKHGIRMYNRLVNNWDFTIFKYMGDLIQVIHLFAVEVRREGSKVGLEISVTAEDELAMIVSLGKNCLPKT